MRVGGPPLICDPFRSNEEFNCPGADEILRQDQDSVESSFFCEKSIGSARFALRRMPNDHIVGVRARRIDGAPAREITTRARGGVFLKMSHSLCVMVAAPVVFVRMKLYWNNFANLRNNLRYLSWRRGEVTMNDAVLKF